MFRLRRWYYLKATETRFHQISRVTHSRARLVSYWAKLQKPKWHDTSQQLPDSDLLKHVRPEGFKTRDGISVKPGDTVELEGGNFLRVKEVLHNSFHDRYWIVGWRFVRNKETLGLPERYPNELYWVVHLWEYNPRPAKEQSLARVDESQILRKRTMNMVSMTSSGHPKGNGADLKARGDGVLHCRWKHVILTRTGKRARPLDAFQIPAAEITEASFQRLRAEDCDGDCIHNNRTVDETLRRSWPRIEERGAIESTEFKSLRSAVEALSLNDNTRHKREPAAYTFADVCCGGGGASRGAEVAGLQLRWALDHNAGACETYRLNFPEVRLYHKTLKDMIHMGREDLNVDIMHISPPCQAFSRANTSPNLHNDTLNIAINMEVGSCLDVVRPRIVTLEQTSGLMSLGHASGKHREHWSKLISQFTSRSYSVAWGNVHLAELGLPQPRKRLIMIASWYVSTNPTALPSSYLTQSSHGISPGEPLPHFPHRTHISNPHPTFSPKLKPFTTVHSAIANIPPNWPDHSIPRNLKVPREPYDKNALLPLTILTNRSTNTHPNGLRILSLRELACLQGFPLKHRFAEGGATMTQIGNAFPPSVAAVLYKCIKGQLLRRDGLKA